MSTIEKLAEYFSKFPGIGPRQSRRFVYFLLRQSPTYIAQLSDAIGEIKKSVALCALCYRFFNHQGRGAELCAICANTNRDATQLMIVEKDVDFENIERAGTYKGYYFILGGTLSLLERKSGTIRAEELKKTVKDRAKEGLEEVVLALSASPDGEHTTLAVREILSPLAKEHSFKISMLGRGLSTGLELEYSDPETIKNALKNRA